MTSSQHDSNGNTGADRRKGVILGAGVGIIAGAAAGNPGVGLVFGAALGLVLGPALARKFR